MTTQLGKKAAAKGIDPVNTILWIVVGGAAGVGAYFLFKPSAPTPQAPVAPPGGPGQTTAGDMPSTTPPSDYANMGAVATRLDEVNTLWNSGNFDALQTLTEVETLQGAIAALRAQGIGEENTATDLLHRLDLIIEKVNDWLALHPESQMA